MPMGCDVEPDECPDDHFGSQIISFPGLTLSHRMRLCTIGSIVIDQPALNSNSVRVRKGTPEDGDQLCDLIGALADYEHLPRPTPEARARLVRDAFGPTPRIDIWFGEYGGTPVGYAISFYTYSTFL